MKERPWAQMWNRSWNLCDLPTCTSFSTCLAAPAVTKQKTFGFSASATKWNSVHSISSTPPLHLSLPSLIYRLCEPLWEHFSYLLNRCCKKCSGIHHLVGICEWSWYVHRGSNINILIIDVKTKWISIHFQQDSDTVESRSPASTLHIKWSLIAQVLYSELVSCEFILVHQ